MKSPLIFTLVPLLCLCACDRSDDNPTERVDSLVDQRVEEIQAQVEVFCDCWDDYGFESRTQCSNEFFYAGPSQVRCIKDAFHQDASAAIDYLECVVPLEREYTECLDQQLECTDYSSGDACGSDFSIGFDDCIGLPSTISRDLDACLE